MIRDYEIKGEYFREKNKQICFSSFFFRVCIFKLSVILMNENEKNRRISFILRKHVHFTESHKTQIYFYRKCSHLQYRFFSNLSKIIFLVT